MSNARDAIIVDPCDASVVVDIFDATAGEATVYTAARGDTPVSLPDTITTLTTYYVECGAYDVSLKVNGVELGTATGGRVHVEPKHDAPVIVLPVAQRTAEREATDAGGGSGVVDAVVAGSGISVDATDPANPIVAATGGGAGGVVLAHVPFDYATPDLDTGAALYVPTIGDVVLNAWIEVDIAFDGTSFGDIGTFVDDIAGMYGQATGQGQDMTVADDESAGTGWLYNNNWPSLMGIGDSTTRRRCVPAKFTAANPVKVVVSQDGTTTGGASGATQGSAVLWLLIATPA